MQHDSVVSSNSLKRIGFNPPSVGGFFFGQDFGIGIGFGVNVSCLWCCRAGGWPRAWRVRPACYFNSTQARRANGKASHPKCLRRELPEVWAAELNATLPPRAPRCPRCLLPRYRKISAYIAWVEVGALRLKFRVGFTPGGLVRRPARATGLTNAKNLAK